MSIDNNPTVDTDDQNLDDFSAEFFGQNKADPEPTNSESDNDEDVSTDAPPEDNQDTQDASDEDDTTDGSEEDTTEADEDAEEQPAPKPKKNSAQERISELTAARREAERRADALEARLAALEGKDTKDAPTPAPANKADEVAPPKPTDTNEDGTDKYPLGEFDPNFITDLADFRVEQRFAEREAQEQEKAAQAKQQEQMGQLEAEWNGQVETARERYPDYNEKLAELQPVFSNVDEHYGDYLSTTLMSMEKGTDILYYLAANPDEARAIVDSGPQRATIALGRLEARFLDSEESAPARKASNAPPPPPTNKGASAAKARVSGDTDDLDAFEALFFKK